MNPGARNSGRSKRTSPVNPQRRRSVESHRRIAPVPSSRWAPSSIIQPPSGAGSTCGSRKCAVYPGGGPGISGLSGSGSSRPDPSPAGTARHWYASRPPFRVRTLPV
ncbi:Uncharacterised protein [Mycobacteroides abscessus subsp. abscessus]|nr:Uncharacterised protein [Mycobacteroides abscessus subsp. abscessus]